MRLLDTHTGQFVEKDPEAIRYSILSHTWDREGEQTYEQLKNIQQRYHSEEADGAASPKLVGALPTALGRLTESEVEALLRLVAETFGLPIPAPAPSPSDPSDVPVHTPCPSTPSSQSIWDDPELSPKIKNACRVARENGYRYIWIDSCCINKSSSSELSEAINSMYKWYGLAAVCYAYLADVPPGKSHNSKGSAFRKSRWFGRGWTLQELIAPLELEFLSQDWSPIGSKHTLVDLVESVTKIDRKALLCLEPLDVFSIAQRLSWAAKRKTTRVEDQAYSLLGLFGINMPTLYGEGDRAFRRLQEQIIQRIPDQSLFAWRDICLPPQNHSYKDTPTSISLQCPEHDHEDQDFFPRSPWLFKDGSSIHAIQHHTTQLPSSHFLDIKYTPTPYGICTQMQMIPLTQNLLQHAMPGYEVVQLKPDSEEWRQWYLAILQCEHVEYPGHLLGRVCYITRSESNGKNIIHPGWLRGLNNPDLFLLPPETVKHFHQQTEEMTVYIPHPNSATPLASSSLLHRRYTTLKLLLLRQTRYAMRSQGYSATLRDPDLDHPTTHQLTLSNDSHTITVELHHTLEQGGRVFTIEAEVNMSESGVPLNSALGSDQRDGHRVSWSDSSLWKRWSTELGHRSVQLSGAGAGTLTVDLGLDLAGGGHYFLDIDVLSE